MRHSRLIREKHIFKEENTMTQTWKKIATVSLAAVMLTGSLAGCGKKAVSIDKENPSINVMTKAYNTEYSITGQPCSSKNLKNFLVQS